MKGVNRELLKTLQDVDWSEEEEEQDCMVCAETLDLSDLNFKPCQCGLQICQFCYNRLLSTDARCPGCRRTYDAKAVIFQPVDLEEVKRAKDKKTRKARLVRQLGDRRYLLDVRILVKNTVYIVGMKLPVPGDDALPLLRSPDYFGQYGKVTRVYFYAQGLHVVYVRREDAARAIAALDGYQMCKATFGSVRYCEAFLRGQKCDSHNCINLHEWGGDGDVFTKEDMVAAMKAPAPLPAEIPSGPLGSASWGKAIRVVRRPPKSNLVPLTKNPAAFPLPTPSPTPPPPVKREKKRPIRAPTPPTVSPSPPAVPLPEPEPAAEPGPSRFPTTDPIMLHSPFEEPVIFPFPVTDPDFSLSFETDRVFTPLPFDRVMVGLAEIGILLPDLEPRKHEWRDSFKPFDVDMESDGPRTTSRFDFARSR